MNFALVLIAFSLGQAGERAAIDGPAQAPPANQWVKLPGQTANPYVYSQPLYVPSRKQVLHWGATSGASVPHNDVWAFDAATGRWTADGPSTKLPVTGLGIHTKGGKGAMLADGTPAPSFVVNAVCYDTRRDRLVYVLNGLMAAYDPAAKTWHDLKASAALIGDVSYGSEGPYGLYERGLIPERGFRGERIPGGPPVYGAGVCYDPVNDEILLFPHWGSQNNDMRAATGQVSGHSGTWRYSFKDNLWQRVGRTFGTVEVRDSRDSIVSVMAQVSHALDDAWRVRRLPDAAGQKGVVQALQTALAAARTNGKALPDAIQPSFTAAISSLEAAHKAGAAADWERVQSDGAAALRILEALLDRPLRVEPPPRCAAPMVYDAKNKVIILFGGLNGLVRTDLENHGRDPEARGLNDTWLYDVTTRQWHEASTANRPPAQRQPLVVFNERANVALLVTRGVNDKKQPTVTLWSFDAARKEWSRLHDEPWPHAVRDTANLAFDEAAQTLVLTQGPDTFVFRLAVDQLRPTPAPKEVSLQPLVPQQMPADDRDWLAKVKSLPANQWIHPRPPREADTRDWGNAAVDPIRGWVYYFGGGHSTYQVNDVAIYSVGANRWVHAAGDHNDPVPPVNWDGVAMGMRGGPPAGHQRNSYVAFDGRLFVNPTFHSRRWDAEVAKLPGARVAWFYDFDRGGVWRQRPIADVVLGPGVPGSYGRANLSDPSGKILGFAGHLEPYDGRFFSKEAYFSSFDIDANTLTVKKIPEPTPGWVGEGRPYCLLPDKGQVFFYEYRPGGGHATWIYDIKANRFVDLKPKNQPPGDPRTVEYLNGQDAVFAIIGKGEQWVYSFKHNNWQPLPLASDGPIGFASPYAQLVYVPRYDVLVNTGSASRGVAIMRPDVKALKWE